MDILDAGRPKKCDYTSLTMLFLLIIFNCFTKFDLVENFQHTMCVIPYTGVSKN
jgi:hypothetical protein